MISEQTVYIVTEGSDEANTPDGVLGVYESLEDAFAFVPDYDAHIGAGEGNTDPFMWEIEAVGENFHAYCQRNEHTRYHITGSCISRRRETAENGARGAQAPASALG